MSEPREAMRLDKWLWQARFFKTRAIAARLLASGKARINAQRITRASRMVAVGDVLTFPQARRVRVVRVLALGERRGPASEAATLYLNLDEETPPALE